MNAFTDPSVGDTETYHDASRRFAAQSRRLEAEPIVNGNFQVPLMFA